MKKSFTLILAFAFFTQTISAAVIANEPVKAVDISIPLGNTGKAISLQYLSTISVKDFQELSGKKMKGADKLMFKVAQRKIRSSINDDGTLNNKQLEKMYKKSGGDSSSGFNIGGFALGLFLGLIGVLIAYIINNDNNKSRHTWAWIGLAAALLLSVVLFGI